MWTRWARGHVGLLRIGAFVVPLALCVILYGLNPVVTTLEAALLLVIVEVAAAATGDRLVGIICGLSGAVGFTYFLTQPYLDFHIENRQDIELAVALLVIGFVVGELAAWGSRQAEVASARGDYLDGVVAVADLLVTDGSHERTSEEVAHRIQRVLASTRSPTSPDRPSRTTPCSPARAPCWCRGARSTPSATPSRPTGSSLSR